MRVIPWSIGIAQYTRDQAGDSIDQHQGRKFSTGKHVIANGYLVAHQVLAHTFIHTFVAPTQQRQMVRRVPGITPECRSSQLSHHCLR